MQIHRQALGMMHQCRRSRCRKARTCLRHRRALPRAPDGSADQAIKSSGAHHRTSRSLPTDRDPRHLDASANHL